MLKCENGSGGCDQQSTENCRSCADEFLNALGFRSSGRPALISGKEAKQARFEEEKETIPLTDPGAKQARLACILPKFF